MLLNHLLGATVIGRKEGAVANNDPLEDLGLDKDYDLKRLFFSKQKLRPLFPAKYEYRSGVPIERSIFKRIHLFLTDPDASKVGERTMQFVFVVILISCISFIIQTLPELQIYTEECKVCKPVVGDDQNNSDLTDARLEWESHCRENHCEPGTHITFNIIEMACVAVFSLDYVIRVLTAFSVKSTKELAVSKDFEFKQFRALKRTLLYACEWMNIVDLVAIVPFYIQIALGTTGVSLSIVRVLRLIRLVRMFRFGQFSSGMLLFLHVIRTSLMPFFIIFVFTMFGMIVFGSLIFYAERGTWDPATGMFLRPSLYYLDANSPSPYTSIPASFWWVLVTFTTTGYGDMFPTTAGGRVIGVICMYTGVLFISMPITVVGSNFADAYLEQQRKIEEAARKNRTQAKVLHNLLFMHRLSKFRKGWNRWVEVTQLMKREEEDILIVVQRIVEKIVADEMALLKRETDEKLDAIEDSVHVEAAFS